MPSNDLKITFVTFVHILDFFAGTKLTKMLKVKMNELGQAQNARTEKSHFMPGNKNSVFRYLLITVKAREIDEGMVLTSE